MYYLPFHYVVVVLMRLTSPRKSREERTFLSGIAIDFLKIKRLKFGVRF